MSITALLFRWGEEPMISFSGNFQTNNFNEIFQFLILLCSTLCIPLSVESSTPLLFPKHPVPVEQNKRCRAKSTPISIY
ncbi:hypothetical protein HN873_010001 [Arachis hypogaea]